MSRALVIVPREFWDEATEALIRRGYSQWFVHMAIRHLWGIPQ